MVRVSGVDIEYWDDGIYFPAEDTLLLLDNIAEGEGRFLDIGTGTGIVGIKAALCGYSVTSTDIDARCLYAALRNSRINGVETGLVRCNLLDAIRGTFDIIAFNPPYLPDGNAPDRRLSGGEYGFELALRLLTCSGRVLSEEGKVMMVLSSLGGFDRFAEIVPPEWKMDVKQSFHASFETVYLAEFRRNNGSAQNPVNFTGEH